MRRISICTPTREMRKGADAGCRSDVMTLFNPLSGVVHWLYEDSETATWPSTSSSSGPDSAAFSRRIAARHAGAKTVTISGLPQDTERALLWRSELGADAIVDVSKEDIVERVRDVTGGDMADVVLDMSAGSTEPILQAHRRGTHGRTGRAGGAQERQAGQRPGHRQDRRQRIAGARRLQLRHRELARCRARDIAVLTTASCLARICSHSFALDEADLAVRTLGREVDDGKEVVHVSLVMAPK